MGFYPRHLRAQTMRPLQPQPCQEAAASSHVPAASTLGVEPRAGGIDVLSKRYPRLDEGNGLGAVSRGSFGSVYAAVDTTTGQTVAVKRQRLPSDAASRELSWYLALSHASHANVMGLLDHFVVCDAAGKRFLYMVFDFMDTTVWHMWIQRRRVLPLGMLPDLLGQIARGLGHLHLCGLVHTDLSMANLLVGRSGLEPLALCLVRIADLGMSVSAIGLVLPQGREVSTEYIRAPEVILGLRELTTAVDLWALGVVSLALCCGTVIFHRVDGYEPQVPGLDQAEGQNVFVGSRTFGNQVAFLGRDGLEPSLGALPGWGRAAEYARMICVTREQPSAFLSDSSLVLRPVESAGAASEFILGLLCWDPSARLSATSCASHVYVQGAVANDPASHLVARATESSVRQVVMESLRCGVAVDYQRLVELSLEPVPAPASPAVTTPPGSEIGTVPSVKRCRVSSKRTQARGDAPAPSHEPRDAPSLVLVAHSTSSVAVSTAHAHATSQASSHAAAPLANLEAPCCELPGEPSLQRAATCSLLKRCACRGNCGRRSCKSRKNAIRTRPSADGYCDSIVVDDGNGLCPFCTCEACGLRGRQQVHGLGRWCTGCAKRLGATQASSRTYINVNGRFSVERRWSLQLQLSARFAWVSGLGPSVGGAFWSSFVMDFLDWRGYRSVVQVFEPGDVMFLLLMACVRWPEVLRQGIGALEGFEPRDGRPSDFYAYFVRLLRRADGHTWKHMFDEISQGRNTCYIGLLWLCKILGFVREYVEGDADVEVVRIGVSQKQYVIERLGAKSENRIRKIFEGVQASQASGQDRHLVPSVVASCQDLLSFCGRVCKLVDLVVGTDSTLARGYCTRAMMGLLEKERGPEVWDPLRMDTLAEFLPDERRHLEPLSGLQAKEVRLRFAMSPLQVSAEACCWGRVPDSHLEVLNHVGYKDILNAVSPPLLEPMASSLASVAERGRVWHPVPGPTVWVRRLQEEWESQ